MYGARYFGDWFFGRRFFGGAGLTSPGYYYGVGYFGGAYFGSTYFGKQADTSPLTLTVSSGLSAAAATSFSTVTIQSTSAHTVTVSSGLNASASSFLGISSLDYEYGGNFDLSAPLQLSSSASASFSATIDINLSASSGVGWYFGGGYFGSVYYGRNYFGTDTLYELTCTAGVSATASTSLSAGVQMALGIDAGTLSAYATGSFSADIVVVGGAATAVGVVTRRRSPTRNYIIGGRRYRDLTVEEVASIVNQQSLERSDVKVAVGPKKPHVVSRAQWADIKAQEPPVNEDDILLLL